MTYGCCQVTNDYLNNIKSDDNFQFIAIPIVFIIFRNGFKSTKFAKDSYTKFWHLVFGAFYILTLIEVLFYALYNNQKENKYKGGNKSQ